MTPTVLNGGLSTPTSRSWDRLVTPVSEEWFIAPPPPRKWLLRDSRANGEGVLPLGVVGQLVAEGGAGKTQLLMQLAIAVATGTRWIDTFETTKGRVLLGFGEEDLDEAKRRAFRGRRATSAPIPSRDSMVALPLRGTACALIERDKEGNGRETQFGAWLKRYIAENGPWSLIIVDPLSRFAGLDAETDNAAGTRYIQALEALAPDATVLGSHHTNKLARGQGGRVEPHSARGSSSIIDGPRWVATLARERFDHGDLEVNKRIGKVATLTPGGKSNVSAEADPILLRYDRENGGALVPVSAVDRELILAARSGEAERSAKTATRGAERARARQEREKLEAEQEAARLAAKVQATRQQDAEDDAALRAILKKHPGLDGAAVDGKMRAARSCGDGRVRAAVARLEIVRRPLGGRSHATGHWLPEDAPDGGT